jgi:hypothetical protein
MMQFISVNIITSTFKPHNDVKKMVVDINYI